MPFSLVERVYSHCGALLDVFPCAVSRRGCIPVCGALAYSCLKRGVKSTAKQAYDVKRGCIPVAVPYWIYSRCGVHRESIPVCGALFVVPELKKKEALEK